MIYNTNRDGNKLVKIEIIIDLLIEQLKDFSSSSSFFKQQQSIKKINRLDGIEKKREPIPIIETISNCDYK